MSKCRVPAPYNITETRLIMNEKNNKQSKNLKVVDAYDDGNIPQTDLPKDIIPDEVPRKDGPGGESSRQ